MSLRLILLIFPLLELSLLVLSTESNKQSPQTLDLIFFMYYTSKSLFLMKIRNKKFTDHRK